ncbi:MAG: ABC transporter substrate-binding protein [Pseudomonadota bacterium]
MIPKRGGFQWILSLLLILVFGSLAGAGESGFKKLTFLPHWSPQAQFAGYYLALEKGFYRKHGIDLTLLQGGPARSAMEYLRDEKADVVTLWLSSALQLANQGVEVVNVGQVIQRSALMLVAKKSSGIHTPEQMNGKKVGLWPADFQIQPQAFFDKFNLKVHLVTTQSPLNLFLRDGVQVSSVMWYNEYHTLINSGLDPEEMTLFFFHEFDLNFPEDGIYMRKEAFEKDPGAGGAFAAASIEGWRYAFDHPQEALDLILSVMEAAHVPANRVHQRWMLERMRDLIIPDSKGEAWGILQRADYRRVGEILVLNGLIWTIPPYESFFRNSSRND